MPPAVAGTANFCSTPRAFSVFAATVYAAGLVDEDMGGFNPFAAAFGGTVNAVFGSVFLVFLIPCFLEL